MSTLVPSVTQELFLAYLEVSPSIKEASEHAGISPSTGYEYVAKFKEVIQSRARDKLTMATLRAVDTVVASLDADGSLEKGELKLKAAAEILDRSGITKHTNVDVQVESTNGLFLIPTKALVPPEEPIEAEYHEFTEDYDGDLQSP